jgi:hypothetical protein
MIPTLTVSAMDAEERTPVKSTLRTIRFICFPLRKTVNPSGTREAKLVLPAPTSCFALCVQAAHHAAGDFQQSACQFL